MLLSRACCRGAHETSDILLSHTAVFNTVVTVRGQIKNTKGIDSKKVQLWIHRAVVYPLTALIVKYHCARHQNLSELHSRKKGDTGT